MKKAVIALGVVVVIVALAQGCENPPPGDAGLCTVDEDCGVGRRCIDGACLRNCASTADCHDGERCVELLCIPDDGGGGDGGGDGGGGDGDDGGVEPPSDAGNNCEGRAPNEAELRAEFDARDIGAHYECATCHRGGGDSPTGVGGSWGTESASPSAGDWFEPVVALADRDKAAPIASTSLATHFDDINNTHPVDATARDDVKGFIEYSRTTIVPAGCE